MALLCHCHVVSDHFVEEAIWRGANTAAEVADHCGAGSRCGGCLPAIEALLERCVVALDAAAA
jgi:bacterioferritin-associated ferredoxin